MQLVVDVGNTETVVGLVNGRTELRAHWRISTAVPRTVDEYRHLLTSLLAEAGPGRPDAAVVGSVVPDATAVLMPTLAKLITGPVHLVRPDTPLSIRLDVEEPRTVGADRIVNTLAVRELYGRDTIAVDLGTATTFDLITADGTFMGGVIAPGVSAGLEWLGRRTAKLPRVELLPPEATIGPPDRDVHPERRLLLRGGRRGRHGASDRRRVGTPRSLRGRHRWIRRGDRAALHDGPAHRAVPHPLRARDGG